MNNCLLRSKLFIRTKCSRRQHEQLCLSSRTRRGVQLGGWPDRDQMDNRFGWSGHGPTGRRRAQDWQRVSPCRAWMRRNWKVGRGRTTIHPASYSHLRRMRCVAQRGSMSKLTYRTGTVNNYDPDSQVTTILLGGSGIPQTVSVYLETEHRKHTAVYQVLDESGRGGDWIEGVPPVPNADSQAA